MSDDDKRTEKLVRALNAAGDRVQSAHNELASAVFDLQTAVDVLLPLPPATDIRRTGRLLAVAELQMSEVRGCFARLEVRLAQLHQLAAVATR